jgi:hypothetical protein
LWERDPFAKTDLGRLARRLLHSRVALGVTIVLVVSFVLVWRARGPSRPPGISVAYEDIVQVRALPAPECTQLTCSLSHRKRSGVRSRWRSFRRRSPRRSQPRCVCLALRDQRGSLAACRARRRAQAGRRQPLFPGRTRSPLRVGDGELIELVADGLDRDDASPVSGSGGLRNGPNGSRRSLISHLPAATKPLARGRLKNRSMAAVAQFPDWAQPKCCRTLDVRAGLSGPRGEPRMTGEPKPLPSSPAWPALLQRDGDT